MEPQNETAQPNEPETTIKKPVLTLPAAVLTGFALIALAIFLTIPVKEAPAPQPAGPNELPTSVPADIVKVRANDHVQGDATEASVIVFEYSDSDCAFCAKFHPTLQSVVADYDGRVAWVYRQFPLDIHPNAYTEAIALECAAKIGGNGAFWGYLDTVIDVTLEANPKSNTALMAYATDMGINAETFKRCLADPDISARVDADIAEAESIGARGTPFSVAVNTKTGKQVVIPGAYPLEDVKEMIDSIL